MIPTHPVYGFVAALLFLHITPVPAYMECDKIYKMDEAGGPRSGNFSSPGFEEGVYPPDLQCIFTFIAKPGWRVKITFHQFALTGTATGFVFPTRWTRRAGRARATSAHPASRRASTRPTSSASSPSLPSPAGVSSSPFISLRSLGPPLGSCFLQDGRGGRAALRQLQLPRLRGGRLPARPPVHLHLHCQAWVESQAHLSSVCAHWDRHWVRVSYKMDEAGGPRSGNFSSSGFEEGVYPPDLQCIFTFIAKPGWRVKLTFHQFALTGTATGCDKDYVDIYGELENPHVDLLDQQLSGRFCGSVSPPIRISLHYTLLLIFHTRAASKGDKGFHGTYAFIPEDEFVVGTPASPGECGFTIFEYNKKTGVIKSPTYPGAYPSQLECFYKLSGKSGQRIRLYFRDFDLYFGGEHCPYDSLTIYDGDSAGAPVMRKVCGIQQKLELFSYGQDLYLMFHTARPPHSQHRGFLIQYTFSDNFVDVGNTSCTYILDGLQGVQDLEKVILNFHAFSITSAVGERAGCGGKSTAGLRLRYDGKGPVDTTLCGDLSGELDPRGGPYSSDGPRLSLRFTGPGTFQARVTFQTALSSNSSCEDGGLLAWSEGQDWKTEAPELRFCTSAGTPDALPPALTSRGPRLVLRFKSAPALRDAGFKAEVRFQTDFGIPGTAVGTAENKCQFRFDRETGVEGHFNSPRYPSNYPVDTTCIYFLNAEPGQLVRVWFEQFALDRGLSSSASCGDWVALWDVWANGTERLIHKYCAHHFPGPIVSSFGANRIRVVFNSDSSGTITGFKALYDFIRQPPSPIPPTPAEGCGGIVESFGGLGGGNLSSQGFPNRYEANKICNWEIRVPEGRRILLEPIDFNVEGQMGADVDCRQAAVRVYIEPGKTFSHEFCGTDMKAIKHFVSNSSTLRISFLTSPDKVNGLHGFNFSWTEIFPSSLSTSCADERQFRCMNNDFCIDERLRCNGAPNCGSTDESDEAHCLVEETGENSAVILGGAGAGLVAFLILILACAALRRRTRASRTRHHHKTHSAREMQRPPLLSAQV